MLWRFFFYFLFSICFLDFFFGVSSELHFLLLLKKIVNNNSTHSVRDRVCTREGVREGVCARDCTYGYASCRINGEVVEM